MPTALMPVTIPKELQDAVNAAAFPIMAKLKIRGPISVTVDPPPAPSVAIPICLGSRARRM